MPKLEGRTHRTRWQGLRTLAHHGHGPRLPVQDGQFELEPARRIITVIADLHRDRRLDPLIQPGIEDPEPDQGGATQGGKPPFQVCNIGVAEVSKEPQFMHRQALLVAVPAQPVQQHRDPLAQTLLRRSPEPIGLLMERGKSAQAPNQQRGRCVQRSGVVRH
jgi:hypothetical protein